MGLSAIAVLGVARPGVIAEVTSAFTRHGANIEDSAMTLLGGHMAMMMLVSGQVPPASAFPGLTVTAAEVGSCRDHDREGGLGYVLTVHGPDRPGIVSSVSEAFTEVSGIITSMTTRLYGSLYVLIADVWLPAKVDVAALMRRLAAVGAGLGCAVTFRPAEAEVL
ncbi:glycine cleavage system protein R [Planomonospora venezuelensis]|uniref:Glycine cleavage system transcriptional repressor n=1 Tax=Planomonospora venezuelensis TaxID=1999 RepID=A0A841D174_PLAVE|nr:ACT domain-containing protein [Planomonospora venezuelensis]MBB5962743.1 glycine cleavage system transcriptional repressor [Planomonospora venezuelensis]GIM99461.1 hypothetical protein Pve01_11200 [Planomonospora venezuelensis]